MSNEPYIREPRTLCYIRQSLTRNEQQSSAEYQYDECYAAWERNHQRLGMPPWAGADEAFVDIDASGRKTKLAERPEGRRLLRKVRSGDHVIVWRIDRLGRRIFDIMETVGRLVEKTGIRLHVANLQGQVMDLGSVPGKCVLMGLALAAEIEGEAISERVKANHAYRKKMGKKTQHVPPSGLGWKWERVNGVRVEVPDMEQRYALSQIHALRVTGLTWCEICRRMNTAGILNRGRTWKIAHTCEKYKKYIKQFKVAGQEITAGGWTGKAVPAPELPIDPEVSTPGWMSSDKYATAIENKNTDGVKRKWELIDGRMKLVRVSEKTYSEYVDE